MGLEIANDLMDRNKAAQGMSVRPHLNANPTLNNFNILRLAAASLVIFSHGIELPTGLPGHDWMFLITGRSFAWYGVNIFFAISGYLIFLSWCRRPSLVLFCWARFLRIMPGLICMLIVTVLILGAAFSSLSLLDFLTSSQTRTYFLGSLSIVFVKYELPGVFTTNPLQAVNGSLWTLRYEVLCYAGVALMGIAGLMRDRWNRRLVLMTCLAIEVCVLIGFDVYGLSKDGSHIGMGYELARLAMCFHLGGLYAEFEDKIRLRALVLIGGVALTGLLARTPLFVPAANLTTTYAAFWFAFVPDGRWISWSRTAPDYSFGTYIYAFPVQQAIVASTPAISSATAIFGGLALTLLFAALSWHLIERPALRLKNSLLIAAKDAVQM